MRDWVLHISSALEKPGDVSDYQLCRSSLLPKSIDLVSADFFQLTRPWGRWLRSAWASIALPTRSAMRSEHYHLERATFLPFAIVGDAYWRIWVSMRKAGVAYGRLTPRDMTLSPRAAYAREQSTLLFEVHRRGYGRGRSA